MVGCLTSNAPARRFYEALGGRLLGKRAIDVHGTPLQETVYGWDAGQVAQLLCAAGRIIRRCD